MTRVSLALIALLSLAACDNEHTTPLQQKPGASKDALENAKQLELAGNVAGASAVYAEITAKPDAPAEAYRRLGSIYRKTGRSQEAVTLLKQAREKNPEDTLVLSELGYALIAAKKPEEAVNIFDELSAIEPTNAMHYNGKAVAFDNAGNHVAAQEIYQKAIALSPTSANIQNNYAMSLILSAKYDEAISVLEPLVKRGGGATMRQNLAMAYGLKGDSARALDLSRQDLSPEQAQENLRFYEQYNTLKKK